MDPAQRKKPREELDLRWDGGAHRELRQLVRDGRGEPTPSPPHKEARSVRLQLLQKSDPQEEAPGDAPERQRRTRAACERTNEDRNLQARSVRGKGREGMPQRLAGEPMILLEGCHPPVPQYDTKQRAVERHEAAEARPMPTDKRRAPRVEEEVPVKGVPDPGRPSRRRCRPCLDTLTELEVRVRY